MAQTGRSYLSLLLRRLLPAVILTGVVWAAAAALFTVDVTEYLGGTRYLYCQTEDGQSLVAEYRDAIAQMTSAGAEVNRIVAPA